ncbi:MAG TPA: arsinothricin resistance N-acetyltransferase ArsN1 family B [Polyangia bacterium]|jgi:phosphinothricin acetyltransferase|nr:arsinothricin resistance N-acetyltransferase ArsN1 family B [Polyangia bacterium]
MFNIRIANKGDAAAVAAIYRPYVTDAVTSFEVDAPSAADMAARIDAVLVRAPWLVCAGADGEVVGYAYASPHRERAAYLWSVDVAVYIHAAHHRHGIGRALYEKLFALLRLQGFYVAHAGVTLPNAASVGLHESLGFVLVGVYPAVGWKFGAWRDVGWWRLPLQELVPTPAPPLSVAEAQTLPAWTAVLQPRR